MPNNDNVVPLFGVIKNTGETNRVTESKFPSTKDIEGFARVLNYLTVSTNASNVYISNSAESHVLNIGVSRSNDPDMPEDYIELSSKVERDVLVPYMAQSLEERLTEINIEMIKKALEYIGKQDS